MIDDPDKSASHTTINPYHPEDDRYQRRRYKRWHRSKTIWLSIILAIFGVLESSIGMLQHLFRPEYYGFIFMGIGMITAILRVISNDQIWR